MIAKDGATGFAFAVLGSPDSDVIIEAPEQHVDMNKLKAEAERASQWFYCSNVLGGCGGQLMTVNGPHKRPHFRHYSQTGCTLRDNPETRDRFTHRIIQNALVAWLERLGYPAKAEHFLNTRSRVDVYTAGAVIEVQLSGESSHSMSQRTERYGGNVTWLFGEHGNIASRDSRLQDDGFVLLVRPAGHRDGVPHWLERRDVEIGVRTRVPRADDTWIPLNDCTFTSEGGVQLGPLGDARDAIAAEREAARAAKQRADEHAADRASEAAKERNRGWTQREPDRQTPPPIDVPAVGLSPAEVERRAALVAKAAARSARQPGPRPTVLGPTALARWEHTQGLVSVHLRHVLRYHGIQYIDSYPEWIADTDGRWTEGLPAHLVDPAWAVVYLTGVVASGPVASIADPSCDPDGLIIERLTQRGLLALADGGEYALYKSLHTLSDSGRLAGLEGQSAG
jgi:hypothetical protein